MRAEDLDEDSWQGFICMEKLKDKLLMRVEEANNDG